MVQTCELVLPCIDSSIAEKIKEIINNLDDPYKIYFSLSMLCVSGNFHILFFQ